MPSSVRSVTGLVGLTLMMTAWLMSHRSGWGRRFWYPVYRTAMGARTHEAVLRAIGPARRPGLQSAAATLDLAYPPSALVLVGLKQERILEVWAQGDSGWKLLRTYPILAASGGAGPKLREGDRQVPEGEYRLTAFNPNSSYHLSIRLDYPNERDRAIAQREGRTDLGGDIFIHGKAVSIGCLALGDDAIEELYVLLADVGLAHSRLLLAPSATPESATTSAAWIQRLYERLAAALESVRGRFNANDKGTGR